MKIDKSSLLLALLISIILTLLFISTYEYEESGNMDNSFFEESHRQFLIQTTIFLIVLFCIELVVFYFVIYKLKMWKQSKR